MTTSRQLPEPVISRLPQLLGWDDSTFEEHFARLTTLAADLGGTAEVSAAAEALTAQDDEELRALGFDLLAAGITRDEDLVDTLVRLATLARTDGGDDLRWSVAQALASTDNAKSAELLAAFAEDADGDVRWQVAFGLPTSSRSTVVTAAWALLQNDAGDSVREQARLTLGSSE